MRIILLLLFLMFSWDVYAQEITGGPVKEIESQRVEFIKIKSNQVTLTVREIPKLKFIRLRSGGSFDKNHRIFLDGSSLLITSEIDGDKTVIETQNLELDIPEVPLQVDIFSGKLLFQKLSKNSIIRLQKGSLLLENTLGRIEIFSGQAPVKIDNHQGILDMTTYNAAVSLKNLSGDGNIECFSGDLSVADSKGNFQLDVYSGSVKVQSFDGSLRLKTAKSPTLMSDIKGTVKVVSEEGPININAGSDTDINVRTKSAKTVISTPNVPTYLNLLSKEGALDLPSGLKVAREGQSRVYRGRYRGEKANLRIQVQSEEGSIQIR